MTNTMILDVLLVSFVGGMLCLDRVVLQAMFSRPIVAAPAIGLLLGDGYTGLIAGAFVELFWIDRLSLGGYIPPNETVVAVLITAASVLAGQILGQLPQGLIVLAVLLFLPLGVAVQKLEFSLCRKNEIVFKEALADAERGDTKAIADKHLRSVLRYYLLSAAFILIALPLGIVLLCAVYPRLAGFAVRGLGLLYGILPLLGCAVALNTITIRGAIPVFCAAFLVATFAMNFVRGL
ncbi:MAG: PTS sugar transporter subunit IIC [Deltaproteobacteria bacterium]|nr:PTS sugar transporter subunit IIC [Deltaproteobacteria bacterium]